MGHLARGLARQPGLPLAFWALAFDGVTVEETGDLERRIRQGWKPSAAAPSRLLSLIEDGAESVRVLWLEKDTLAYLRRGRLERTATCLPHHTAARLQALP